MIPKQLAASFHSSLLMTLLGTALLYGGSLGAPMCFGQAPGDGNPLPEPQRKEMSESLRESTAQLTQELVELYSRRGDAFFFLGEFAKATSDYEVMVELNPQLGDAHWRRGIARFYAGKSNEAARQFEAYHSFDDIDRENGIWRYFSQYRAYGPAKAKAGLLKYRKTDREPFPDVYQLFSGDTTPEAILAAIDKADIDKDEREKRRFYAQLYIGLNHAVEGHDADAIRHLRESTANAWGPEAGYGPRYMWHVGRVHLDLLLAKRKQPEDATPDGDRKNPKQPAGGR